MEEGSRRPDYARIPDAGAPLPAQLPRRTREPVELELWRTILRSACDDLSHPNPAIRSNAARWFSQPHDGSPVSLCDVCRVLDLDSRKVARTTLRWSGLA